MNSSNPKKLTHICTHHFDSRSPSMNTTREGWLSNRYPKIRGRKNSLIHKRRKSPLFRCLRSPYICAFRFDVRTKKDMQMQRDFFGLHEDACAAKIHWNELIFWGFDWKKAENCMWNGFFWLEMTWNCVWVEKVGVEVFDWKWLEIAGDWNLWIEKVGGWKRKAGYCAWSWNFWVEKI
jgi:hypothetical protein